MTTHADDEVDLIAFLKSLWELKHVVVIVAVLFVAASLYIALTATHVFRAQVVVAKVNETSMTGAASLASQFGGLGRLAGFGLGQSGPGQEAQAILESRHLTEEFIRQNDVLKVLAGENAEPPSLWRAVKDFRDLILEVREDATEGISVVAIEWTDPEIAARWANDYVALANQIIRNRALKQSESNIAYLKNQVEQTNVVELERAIYNLIETEIQQLMLANARDEYAFTVVDPAVAPELRVRPRRSIIVLSGGVLGLICGALAVFAISIVRRVRATEGVAGA